RSACSAEEVSGTSNMVVLLFAHLAILLLILAVARAGNIDVRVIEPSEVLEGERFVSSLGEDQTTEDRRSYLHAARERGYTCSRLPENYPKAITLFCAKTPTTTYTDVPKSAEGLRATLAKVSLQAWLPTLLCPPPVTGERSTGSNGDDDVADRKACRGAVEEALATQPLAWVTLALVDDDQAAVMRATVDEVPWLNVLQSFMEPSFAANFHPSDCSMASSALAFARAKTQLLPALRALASPRNLSVSSPAKTANITSDGVGETTSAILPSIAAMKQLSSSPASAGKGESSTANESLAAKNTRPSSSASSSAMPSAGRIASLLALLDSGNERSGMVKTPPFLRMKHPSPQERVSGGVVNVVVEVYLGSALRTSLMAADTTNDGGNSRVGEAKRMEPPLPDYDRCVIRAVVDGSITSSTPVDIADVLKNDGEAAVVIQMDIVPTYDHNPHCSEHPAKALAGWSGWAHEEDVWRLDSRAVDKVCTREAFGAHHIHGELACRHRTSTVAESQTKPVVHGNANEGGWGSAVPSPPSESNLEGPTWEVLATSAMVDYFHTGHLADVLSSSPWTTPSGGESRDNKGADNGDGSKVSNPLFHSPPEEISVSLFLESDPDETVVVVAVPRWLSDGEVWEAAFDACSKAFGPFQGILVNVNDCIDLVISVITAKRVDLFNIMSLRLTAYLRSIRPSYMILGHTGAFPQKVEALGSVLRDGGDGVEKICEVGFNAGHSSLNWLLYSRPSTKVLAFDLGEHEYMRHALDFLQVVFPGRLEVLIGDSSVSIPAYAVAEEAAGRDPHACNILFVDGDHSEDGAYADLVNFRALASRDWNVLAIDDLEHPPVEAAWRRFCDEDKGGRLERVVRASAAHFTHAQENGNGGWDVQEDRNYHKFFMQRGHVSLGIGHFRASAA
ncbi:unnamed protein product, partial [Ectocarpus fasciculatus]